MTVKQDPKHYTKGMIVASAVASIFMFNNCSDQNNKGTEQTNNGSEKTTQAANAQADGGQNQDTSGPTETTVEVKCYGVNDCKGKSECAAKDGSHDCAGKNECKGQGWIKMTVPACKSAGGTTEPTGKKDVIKCEGVNECKGQGECAAKDGSHDCAGKNECKGKGWSKMTSSDCTSKGGTIIP